MTQATFVVVFPPAEHLPPMTDPEGGLQLVHQEDDGFSIIGHVPQAATCIVLVTSDQATINTMIEDDAYLLIEEL